MWPLVLIPHLLTHSWVLVEERYWQIEGRGEAVQDLSRGVCPKGMLPVHGQMIQDRDSNPYGDGTVEYLQKTTCTAWIQKHYPERCISFDRDKWLKISQDLPRKPMDFCIDKWEFPNKKNSYPWIYINFYDAERVCQRQNKRLCTEEEWTFACEGEEAKPYPNGYARNSDQCVIDRPYIAYRGSKLRPREEAFVELDRLWQGKPSGTSPKCQSDFGVEDLTGNIDEWTSKVRPEGKYQSILKGGYWGRVRTRCRPSTRSHNENFVFYQQGFRCCSARL